MAGEVLYFVSDTHLGDGSGADQFRYPDQLLDLLERIEAERAAHLVLLGDFLELWACPLEGILLKHEPILRAVLRLAQRHPVTYVVGNHDCLPWYQYLGARLGSIRITETFEYGRGSLVAVHGHQFDPLNRVIVEEDGDIKPPWTRQLVRLLGIVQRVGGSRTGEAITSLGHWLGRLISGEAEADGELPVPLIRLIRHLLERQAPGERGYPEGESWYEQGAFRYMRAGARYVLMGHTHHPVVRCYGGKQYVNTGSWVWDRYPPTYARFAGGRLELMEAMEHRPYVPERYGLGETGLEAPVPL